MKGKWKLIILVGFVLTGASILSETFSVPAEKPDKTAAKSKPASEERLTVAAARSRAKLLHDIYADMLQVLHRNYFRDKTDKVVVPSRSLEDVFYGMKRRTKINARWISVNANAMHIDHKPKDDFEKAAARAISSGKKEYERVEKGIYRRAGSIPLFNSCLKCHVIIRSRQPRPRFAGLIINIPVKK